MPRLDAAACIALMDELTKLTAQAAATILDLANEAEVRTKADGSPVTTADEAAETIICAGLGRVAPEIPIISEEQAARERPTGIEHGSYFLVDPLDGTREFIAGRDEYTINIALMTDGAPILGIICAPALGLTWRGVVGQGADRMARAAGEGARAAPI
ncbi:MAG: inositol monophosphatase family protein, partial [Xanthobacteraceae bacterium]